MFIYENIRYLCKTKNISIARLEKELSLGNGTIRNWNESSPSIDRVIKVADYFNVSLDYLLNRQASAADADALELAEEIKKLPPDMRKIVDTVIEANKAENEGSAASGE